DADSSGLNSICVVPGLQDLPGMAGGPVVVAADATDPAEGGAGLRPGSVTAGRATVGEGIEAGVEAGEHTLGCFAQVKPASTMHAPAHPSPLARFPSSHCSLSSKRPLPHTAGRAVGADAGAVVDDTGGRTTGKKKYMAAPKPRAPSASPTGAIHRGSERG